MKGTITVNGKRWFERTNGNTYHSVEVYLDGDLLERLPFNYGYGSGYEQSAFEILEKHKPEITEGLHTLWQVKEKGYKLINLVTDVPRKKDL